jgi:hypothetical protein
MQPHGEAIYAIAPPVGGTRAHLVRVACVLLFAFTSAGVLPGSAVAATPETPPQSTAGASNGGVATATTGGTVSIGEITTGVNTGNSITTGDISGSADITGGEIAYPTDVNISQEIAPPIADASGGDAGQAQGAPSDGQVDVNIDNTDKNVNNNKSKSSSTINTGG